MKYFLSCLIVLMSLGVANAQEKIPEVEELLSKMTLEEKIGQLKLAMQLMDEMKAENFTDDDRIYIGGLSMGGMGTYEMLYRKPEMFAAAFAICGGADTEIVKNYQEGLDIWIFHGETDNVVLPEYSKAMAREINHHGGNAKVSLYPNDNHNSWDSAFAEPYLMEWLFSHHKSEKKSK